VDTSPADALTRRLAARDAVMPEMVARLGWPADRIRAEREQALRRLLTVATERSPWHRERLRGLDPARAGESDLASIPSMTKTDLMEHFDAIVTDRALRLADVNDWIERLPDTPLLGRYHGFASGGSSGLRGVFVYDEAAAITFNCMVGRWFMRLGLPPFPPSADAGPIVNLWADRGAHVSFLMVRLFMPPAPLPLVSIPATTPLPAMVERLNALRPWRIGSYASILALLATEARAGRLRIAPQVVMSCGEPLLPEARAEVEAAFGVPVLDYWGMSEGMYAMPCGQGAIMHLPDDLCIVEPVDEAGLPVAAGTPAAKILLTNLFNPVQPLIRYEVTDRVVLRPDPCPCGAEHRAVESVHGRADDVFTYAGGVRVHPLALRAPLGRHRHIAEYQVRQTVDGAHVLLSTTGPVELEPLGRAMEDGLRRAGIASPRVTLERVDALGRQASGKMKRFVPLSSP